MPSRTAETQRPFGDLIQTIVADVALLVRQELRLAAAESKPKLARAGTGVALMFAATLFALGAFGSLTATLIVALALVVPAWLAALIVTVAYGIAGAGAGMQGIAAIKKAGSLAPVQTLQTIKEDVAAIRAGVEQAR